MFQHWQHLFRTAGRVFFQNVQFGWPDQSAGETAIPYHEKHFDKLDAEHI